MNQSFKSGRRLAACAGAAAACLAAAPAASAAGPAAKCVTTKTTVQLTPDGPKKWNIVGDLCLPAGQPPSTVQLLLHGAGYERSYWDLPIKPERQSYVRAMAEQGIATMRIDRIGSGASDHPPGLEVGNDANGLVAHQVTQALRDGNAGIDHAFSKVVLVGHSYGSTTIFNQLSRFPDDADGVIITGMTHGLGPRFPGIPLTFAPAATVDKRFKDLDATYLANPAGTRKNTFYNPDTVEPDMVAYSEQNRQTITVPEMLQFPVPLLNGTTQKFDVPVLNAIGGRDAIFCDKVGPVGTDCSSSAKFGADEGQHYPRAASFEAYAQAGAGHAMNEAVNAEEWFSVAAGWMNRKFPRDLPLVSATVSKSSMKTARTKGVTVRMTSSRAAGSCKITVRPTQADRDRHELGTSIGKSSRTVPAGTSAKRVRLSSATRRALRGARSLTVQAQVACADGPALTRSAFTKLR